MDNPNDSTNDKRHLDRALEVAIRLAFVGLIVVWCGRIIAPFFMPALWGLIIATALYPLFLKLKQVLGGRDKATGVVFILVSLILVLAPTVWLTDSVITGASELGQGLESGSLTVPPPSEKVKEWPAVGERIHGAWAQASANLEAWVAEHRDQLKTLGNAMVSGAASLGGAVVQTVVALIIAGVLMINAIGGGRVAYAFADKMGGEKGRELVDVAIATVRNVVKGVLLVALIQSLMAAVGLVIAGVPGAGFWAFLVLVVAIIQLPPILILGPLAAYVFSANGSNVVAIFFLVWSLVVSGSDGFLKPLFLGRGVAVPMLIILVGAIGGMITAGVIGLFVGAVILSIGFKLVEAWLGDSLKQDDPAVPSG
jgi:predicted PurR-regulated permease PerM